MQEKSLTLGLHEKSLDISAPQYKTPSFYPINNKCNESNWPAFKIQSPACETTIPQDKEINELLLRSLAFSKLRSMHIIQTHEI